MAWWHRFTRKRSAPKNANREPNNYNSLSKKYREESKKSSHNATYRQSAKNFANLMNLAKKGKFTPIRVASMSPENALKKTKEELLGHIKKNAKNANLRHLVETVKRAMKVRIHRADEKEREMIEKAIDEIDEAYDKKSAGPAKNNNENLLKMPKNPFNNLPNTRNKKSYNPFNNFEGGARLKRNTRRNKH